MSILRSSILIAVNAYFAIAAMQAQQTPADSLDNIAGLRAGIEIIRDRLNAAADHQRRRRLPIEFLVLNSEPEPWRPVSPPFSIERLTKRASRGWLSRWIAAPGQSGLLFDVHYDDRIEDWQEVKYRPMLFTTKAVDERWRRHFR